MKENKMILYRSQNQIGEGKGKELAKADQIFQFSEWQEEKMKENCSLIKQWRIQTLQNEQNKYPYLIKEIKDIYFPHLRFLSFLDDSLESIEELNRIRMPSIQRLSLGQNNLISIKGLRKSHFPMLRWINLQSNFIKDGEKMTQIFAKKFDILLIEINLDDHPQCHNIAWTVKLETKQLRSLTCQNETRIKQQAVCEKLREMDKSFVYGQIDDE